MKLIIACIVLTIMAGYSSTAQVVPQKDSADKEKYTIENCINPFNMDKAVTTSVGYQYWFTGQNFSEDGLTVKMSVVGPGQATHAPHRHAEDETFFILEGTARFYLNGKTTTGSTYTSFYCPSNSEHGISNAGTKALKYLVIRKYPKTEK